MRLLFRLDRFDDIFDIRAVNSCDLNGFGAAWNESDSTSDAGTGVADVDADAEPPIPDERDLLPLIVLA